jgi:hypothetical protein
MHISDGIQGCADAANTTAGTSILITKSIINYVSEYLSH